MTVYASKIEATRIAHELEFGVDMTAPGEGSGIEVFKWVPFREGTGKLTLTKTMESPLHVQQRVDGHPTRVALPKMAVYECEVNTETLTTKATNGVTIAQSWLGIILETWMGAKNLMAGTTVNDVAPDQDDFTATVATTLRPGSAIGLATGAGGILEVREIKSKSGSNIVLKHNLSEAPANASTVYGSATYFCNPLTTGDEFKSICGVHEGYTTTDKYVCRGGAVTAVEFTLENGQITKMKVTITYATWDYADGVAVYLDLDAATIGQATYTDHNTLVQADSVCLIGETPGVGTTPLNVSSITITPAITFAKVMTPGGVGNVAQWVRTHVSPVCEVKVVHPYEDQSWFEFRDDSTPLAMLHQIGSAPTEGAFVFSLPNLQVIDVQRLDVDGIASQEVTMVARHDTDTTAESGYEGLAQSAFRIHML